MPVVRNESSLDLIPPTWKEAVIGDNNNNPDKVIIRSNNGNPNNGTQTQTDFESPVSSTDSRNKSLPFCRICHDGDGTASSPESRSSSNCCEPLIAPCKCTGTVALIHLSCLEHWLTISKQDRCEICHYSYKTYRVPRTCNEYFRDGDNKFSIQNMLADTVCFLLLTPLLIVSTYLCTLGANQYFVKERWEAVGLIILSIFLLGVYFTWCHVTVKYHSSVWRSWQRNNQQVRLILGDEAV